MHVTAIEQPVGEIQADAIVIGIHEGVPLDGPAADVDRLTGGQLTRLIEAGEIAAGRDKLTSWLAPAGLETSHVVVVGLGDPATLDRGAAAAAAGSAAKLLAGQKRGRVVFLLVDGWDEERVCAAVSGAVIGCVGQDLYQAETTLHPIEELAWQTSHAAAVDRGLLLGEATNLTRRLVNEPAGKIYPESFAEVASQVAEESGLELESWDKQKLEEEKCGSLLAVAQGSDRDPRLLILRHRGAGREKPHLALVGKGVTFDSGGLSLKPNDSMKTMKCDMAGAATVLGAMQAIARLDLPCHVVGLVGLVENMVSGSAYKLGDVLTARSGKTIEVLNTDAEGRLVLADVLDVALQQEADHLVDLATLTGACVVALGTDVCGVMTNDQDWCDQLLAAAAICGERAWQLPMFPEFAKQIRSKVADIKNIGEGRWGGAITAGKFLEEFVGQASWIHLDIAGPAFQDEPKAWIDAGGSGAMVQTLVQLAGQLAEGEA
jgi:leucyl aminopeptidase